MPKKQTISRQKNNLNETVIMLHGINRSPAFLADMATTFKQAGYNVKNIAYPSTAKTIPEICHEHLIPTLSDIKGTVHLIGHSLGAIIIRYYLSHHQLKNLGRVVMLGPLNGGSKVANIFMNIDMLYKFSAKHYGPAGLSLARKENSIFSKLDKKITYTLGIIAGTKHRWIDSFAAWFIFNEPNDGKVSVESTKLAGMIDHITLDVPHRMGNNPQVIDQTLYFIKNGHFLHTKS